VCQGRRRRHHKGDGDPSPAAPPMKRYKDPLPVSTRETLTVGEPQQSHREAEVAILEARATGPRWEPKREGFVVLFMEADDYGGRPLMYTRRTNSRNAIQSEK